MASHGSAVLVTRRPTWLALMQKRALQIQSINDDFQPHGTWIEKRLLSEEKYLAISCCPDSQVWHPVWFHEVEFDICLSFISLLSGSSPSELLHLWSSIWGYRYPIWCLPWLLPPWLSSLLKRADWSPQKSRLVSSNSSLATTARLHTATSRLSRLEQTNRLTTNPPTEPTHYSDTAAQWHHDTLFASHKKVLRLDENPFN